MQKDGTNTLTVYGAGVDILNSAGRVSDNKWHFVAVAIDQSVIGEITLYIDGAMDSNTNNPDLLTLPSARWNWVTAPTPGCGRTTAS